MKTLKRLTALVLIALLLLQSLAFADSTAVETTDDGQVVVDTEWYNQLLQDVQTYGVSYESFVEDLEMETPAVRYDMLATWAAESPEFHRDFVEYYKMTYPNGTLICRCDKPQPYGATTHANTACPWLFANLTVEEQYEIYTALSEAEQEAYMETLSADAVLALEQHIIQAELGVHIECTDENCRYYEYIALDNDVARYRYLMGELYDDEETEMENFILHMLLSHEVNDICICGDMDSVVSAPGAGDHTEANCPWDHSTAIEKHYAEYKDLAIEHKAFYLLGMCSDQRKAMAELMTAKEAEEAEYLSKENLTDWLKTDEIRGWLSDETVTVDATMLERAERAKSLHSMLLEGNQLVHVYTGADIATYNAATGEITDNRYGLVVGIVNADGTVSPAGDAE